MRILTLIIVLGLLTFLPAAGAAEKAMIVTQVAKPAECIAPVHIRQIDGREKIVPYQGFQIEPGRHTMTGTAKLNVDNCPVARGNEFNRVQPLEAEFEAGKTYYVGLDHRSADRNNWALVIWKIE